MAHAEFSKIPYKFLEQVKIETEKNKIKVRACQRCTINKGNGNKRCIATKKKCPKEVQQLEKFILDFFKVKGERKWFYSNARKFMDFIDLGPPHGHDYAIFVLQ